jgi:hypothetical protein
MASEAQELPPVAVDLISKGIPAHKVLTPHIPLTPKQKALVEAIGAGATKREAYLMTHEPKTTNSKTVSMMASRAASADNVQAALSQQQAVERLRYSQNPLQIRSFLVDSLQHLARTAKKDSDRLQALRMLGQLADVSAFETRSVVTHQTGSDTTARLREKLARLGGVIDVDAHEHTREHPPAHAQGHEGDPTVGGEGQSGQGAGGGARSNNPHESSSKNLPPHEPSDHSLDAPEEDPHPLLKSTIPSMGGITSEEAPMEEGVGSHTGGRKKKERPIWEDPKRWYAETMGEVPKIEWQPREEAREEVQRRLNESGEDGQ